MKCTRICTPRTYMSEIAGLCACLQLLESGGCGVPIGRAVLVLRVTQAQIERAGGGVQAAAGSERSQHHARRDRVLVQPRPCALCQMHPAGARARPVVHRHIHLPRSAQLTDPSICTGQAGRMDATQQMVFQTLLNRPPAAP